MIDFRCTVAGVGNPFYAEAIGAVYQWSKGVPREAIKLCAMSVQYASLNGLKQIPADLVELAANDIVRPSDEMGESPAQSSRGTMRATREAV